MTTIKTSRRVLCLASLCAALGSGPALAQQNVVFWYHFDNPEQTKIMDGLVSDFQAKNPGITINAQNVPWNTYYDKLFTSVVGGKAPDVAMVKLAQQPQLIEMGAIDPIDSMLASWPGKADLATNLLEINKAADGKQYYLPLQYVVIYLYYRADLFAKANLPLPTTCEAFLDAAKKLTIPAAANGGVPQFGFGMRGGRGGQDNWGPFVLSQTSFDAKDLTSAKSVAANTWYVDLFRTHKVVPPSAPNDGFNEIISGFKSGQTAMIFHHIGSAKTMTDALGDKVSAVQGQACGVEVDGLPERGCEQREVRTGHGTDDRDAQRSRTGQRAGAFCQGYGGLSAVRAAASCRAADGGLRVDRVAHQHAACDEWRNNAGADDGQHRQTLLCQVSGPESAPVRIRSPARWAGVPLSTR
jgi:multiple sugar transport system substrate-binding protein